ncbi:MAG: hypothetical protein AAB906_04875, partial [Patescibacteria group bacterium]
VDPGETIVIELKYRLPFKIGQDERNNFWEGLKEFFGFDRKEFYPYSLLWQKQPGAKADHIESRLEADDNFHRVWSYPENIGTEKGWNVSDYLGGDRYQTVLLEKK